MQPKFVSFPLFSSVPLLSPDSSSRNPPNAVCSPGPNTWGAVTSRLIHMSAGPRQKYKRGHCTLFFLLKYSWYTTLLVSGVQQSDSVILIYIYTLFHLLFHYGSLQVTNIVPCAIQTLMLIFYIQ